MKKYLVIILCVLLLTGCTKVTEKDLVPGEQTTPITLPTEKPSTTPSGKELAVHFLDVGQGDSIFIRLPNNKTMLIDGGVKGVGQSVVTYLRQQGVKQLDMVVATHPDADHIGGLIPVLNSISIKKFMDSGKLHTSQTFEEMLTLISEKNIPYIVPKVGDTIKLDKDVAITVLAVDGEASDNNDASIVLKLAYGDVSFLFAGDAGIALEKEIVRRSDVQATILKAGHHGSNTSSSRSFLNSVDPEVTILSYGRDNKYGHPHAEVTTELKKIKSKIYGTAESGHIVVKTNGQTYQVNAAEWTGIGATSSIRPVVPKRDIEIISKDLDAEIVSIKNHSTQPISLNGWQLLSVEGNQLYNFPNISLKAGETLHITSGPNATVGKNKLEWTKRQIWLNDGDAAKLLNAKGEVVSELE